MENHKSNLFNIRFPSGERAVENHVRVLLHFIQDTNVLENLIS